MNMGYPSIDSMINEMTVNGKRLRRETSKLTSPVHTAGGWHLLTGLNGYPNAGSFPGTDLLWSNCDENSGDGSVIIGSQHGGPPGGSATKHVLNSGGMVVAAAGAPWFLRLVDLMGYYRLSTTNVTGTGSRALINTNTFTATAATPTVITYANDWKTLTKVRFATTTTLPAGLSLNTDYWLVRLTATTANVASSYANALAGTFVACSDTGTGTHTLTIQMRNAVGAEAFFVSQTAPATGGPNLTASSYTNSQGTAGRAFQGASSMGAAADAYATRILHSGNAAGRYGAFLQKQGADVGIKSIESFTWSGGTAYTGSGVVALCIAKPLDVDIPLPVSGMFTWMDLVHMCPSLPKVDDGACLQWMLFGAGATTANSPLMTLTDFGWAG